MSRPSRYMCSKRQARHMSTTRLSCGVTARPPVLLFSSVTFMIDVVCGVAGFTAVVSYTHIYDLGRAHGRKGRSLRLLRRK